MQSCPLFYELSVFIDIPVQRDVKTLVSFDVTVPPDEPAAKHEPVRTRYPEDQELGLFDSIFSPDVRVDAALADGLLREGDTIEGMFVVDARKSVPFRAIHARLIAIESTTAHGHKDRHVHQGEAHQIAGEGVMDGHYSMEFQLPVSSPGAKTESGRLFSTDCFVQIELDVPWAKDPKIRIPVTLI